MAGQVSGYNSPLSGTIRVDLFCLYQEAGRDNEARVVWQRIREIMKAYHLKVYDRVIGKYQ